MAEQIQTQKRHQSEKESYAEAEATRAESVAQVHHLEIDAAADDVLYLIDRALGEIALVVA